MTKTMEYETLLLFTGLLAVGCGMEPAAQPETETFAQFAQARTKVFEGTPIYVVEGDIAVSEG